MPEFNTNPQSGLLLKLAHELIGFSGLYQGREYTLIEVINSGPSVVLEPIQHYTVVQNTFQGEAKRFAKSNYTVPFYSEVRHTLHPVLQEFLGPNIVSVLQEHPN